MSSQIMYKSTIQRPNLKKYRELNTISSSKVALIYLTETNHKGLSVQDNPQFTPLMCTPSSAIQYKNISIHISAISFAISGTC